MNRIIFLLSILIVSCTLNSNGGATKSSKNNIKLSINIHETSQDSILVKAFIFIPISELVFLKKDGEFEASIESVLRIEDANSKVQVSRLSKNTIITKKYYEDTRSKNLYQIYYDVLIKKGDYRLIASIKDLDSFNVWDIDKRVEFKEKQDILLYFYKNGIKSYITEKLEEQFDYIWVELSKYKFESNSYGYIISDNDDNNLETGIFNDCKSNDLLFECPILINNSYEDISIKITSNSKVIFTSDILIDSNKSLWSSDIKEVLGVMSYILPMDDIKKMYSLPEQQQKTFILEYIDSRNIDPNNQTNEFLDIIKIRFNYVNKNFSQYNVGWKTDKGKIYIINGPPNSIDSYYDNRRMINFEKWYYTDKEFLFSDERSFGEMELMSQF